MVTFLSTCARSEAFLHHSKLSKDAPLPPQAIKIQVAFNFPYFGQFDHGFSKRLFTFITAIIIIYFFTHWDRFLKALYKAQFVFF